MLFHIFSSLFWKNIARTNGGKATNFDSMSYGKPEIPCEHASKTDHKDEKIQESMKN
jgi:hypothetical protein